MSRGPGRAAPEAGNVGDGRRIPWASVPLLLLAVAAIFVAWRHFEFPGGASPAEAGNPPAAPAVSEDARFRADAWMLPDEPLLGFVKIPGGPFLMGSDPMVDRLAFDNERSAAGGQAVVELPDYYIGRFEVTVGQYRAFVDATGHVAVDDALLPPANHPVASVSWPDALAYARWLEGALREWEATPPELARLLAEGWRITLPTEAQWEKAARGSDGRIFPWGDQPGRDYANFGTRSTLPVGSLSCPSCSHGLADMSGNVWELTRSPYHPHHFDPASDRVDLEADALWVMRGGSFLDGDQNVRAAIRGGADPGVRRPFIGFRLVVSPD